MTDASTLLLQGAERAEAALRAANAALRDLTAEKDPPRPAELNPKQPADLQADLYFKARQCTMPHIPRYRRLC